jgi:hypothetical protein
MTMPGERKPTYVSAVMIGMVVIFIPIPRPRRQRQMNSSYQLCVNAWPRTIGYQPLVRRVRRGVTLTRKDTEETGEEDGAAPTEEVVDRVTQDR